MSGLPEPGEASVRRDNGLVPVGWTALAELEPAAGDEVLSTLARHGVAALIEAPARPFPSAQSPSAQSPAEPSPTGPSPSERSATGPSPRAVLWVDAQRRADAEAVLASGFPGVGLLPPAAPGAPADAPSGTAPDAPAPAPRQVPPGAGAEDPPAASEPRDESGPRRDGLDEDAAWAQIVAGWHRDEAGPVPPWPVAEDVAEPPGRNRRRTDPPADAPGATSADESSAAPAPPPAPGPRDHVPASDPVEDHYVPPPPPPLPRLRRSTIGALLVLAGGILLLFAPGLVGLPGGDAVAIAGIACIVGSVVALVYGMRDAGGGRANPDDGAVV